MVRILAVVALLLAGMATPTLAAVVEVRINLSSQRMSVYQNGFPRHTWAVSTARRGYVTPTGSYRPTRMTTMHYSRKYNNSPMPHSIFFRGGYAIHGTGDLKNLGRPASHGCVRLAPENARTLYNLVSSVGAKNAKISITR